MTKGQIIKNCLKGIPGDIVYDEKLRPYIEYAMETHAMQVMNAYKKEIDKQKRRLLFMIFGVFAKTTWEGFVLKIRMAVLRVMKRSYQQVSNVDKRKYYIVRNSDIGYKVFSVADVKLNKRLRVFGKDVDSVKMHEIADVTIYPKSI